jgi:anti-sigma regulatory factor (Ser/Thr protein kinase)
MEVTSQWVEVRESSQAGDARRRAGDFARRLGFEHGVVERAALVASELGTNLVKHAGGGELFFANDGEGGPLEMLAIDRGPGIADLERACADGFSTAGSLGQGLGAVARMATVFDVYSAPGCGTVLFASIGNHGAAARPRRVFQIGGVCAPKPGEDVCGDAWTACVGPDRDRSVVLVVDGLGHGLAAADASLAAVRTFAAIPERGPADILRGIHEALRATRGAAVSIAEVDRRLGVVRFAGIGNVAASIVTPDVVRHLVSHHGTAGHHVRQVREFQYPWPSDGLLVVHSDGVGTRWALERYPALARRHPAVVAGVLYRDFARGTDDATAVVLGEAA